MLLGFVWTTGVAYADYLLLLRQNRLIFTKEGKGEVNWFNFGTHKTINDCYFEMKQAIARMKHYVGNSEVISESDDRVSLSFIGKNDELQYMDSNELFCIPTEVFGTKRKSK